MPRTDEGTVADRPRRTTVVRLRRLGIIVLAAYVAVCIVVGLFQRRLIYFPTREYEFVPTDVGLSFEEVTLTGGDGVRLCAWLIPHQAPKGTVLFFHGNGGNISHRLVAVKTWHNLGYTVLILDYRGYGRSEGTPSEAGLYRDAQAAWRYLTESRGEKADRIILFGESLGGAVAIDLAANCRPAALVVESTFPSLLAVAKLHYPLLPVGLLLRERYDSLGKIARVSCPKLFFHGTDDELIPLAVARPLYDAATPPKQLIETPGGHNEAGFTYSSAYADRLGAFLDAALARRP